MKNLAAAFSLVLLLGLAGCSGPAGVVGVQEFGTVVGTLADAVTKQPIGGPGTNISCGGPSTHADQNGQFTVQQVPIYTQNCAINAIGYVSQSPSVSLTAGGSDNLGVIYLQPTMGGSSG